MKSIKILTMGLMVLGVLTGVVGCAQDKPLNSLENSRVAKTSDSDEPSAQAMAFIPQQMEPIIQHLGGIENQLKTWNSNSAKSWTELTNHMVAYIEGICSNKVEEALEPTRAEYERRCKKLQAAHDGCCGWGLCLVMLLFVIAIGAFWGKLCQKRPQGNGRVRCIETSLLLAVFLLISLGAYQLTTRIVKCGVSSRASEIADAPNKHSAVLCAYNQLSDEMERWFALFAVLGTFFGLVLPVGAYFLQIRSIHVHEMETEDLIQKRLVDMRQTVKLQVEKLTESQVDMVRLYVIQQFKELKEDNTQRNSGAPSLTRWTYFKWISQMMLLLNILSRSTDVAFVKQRIDELCIQLQIVQKNPLFEKVKTSYEQSGGWAFDFDGDLTSLRKMVSSELAFFEELLANCSMRIECQRTY